MIRMSSIITSSMFVLLLQHPGMAISLAPGDGLKGYQCYNIDVTKLGISREDAWAGRGFPPVFDQPSAASKQIGNAAGPVYVVGPLHAQVSPHLCDPEGACECRVLAEEFCISLDERTQARLGHVGNEVVEQAALPE